MLPIASAKPEDLYARLNSSASGLTSGEAFKRQQKAGPVNIKQRRTFKIIRLLVRQFRSPLVLLLFIAATLSGFLGQTSDSIIILTMIIATGLLSFFQELNAGKAVEKLQAMLQPKCTVKRDNASLIIGIAEIVPGDVLEFNAGDIIPADCRIISCNELQLNETALTGESVPVEKQTGMVDENAPLGSKTNCLWKGTNVISGKAEALVVHTGAETIFGEMEQSLKKEPETAFERDLKGFGYFLLQITLVLSFIILGVNIYFKKPLFDSILFSLAISIGMAPELLPAIMTLSMSAGAKRMLAKKVIVKKLSSIFNFGEVNVLCTDKTGTITEGAVKLHSVCNIEGNAAAEIELFAVLNATLQSGFNNPVDDAIAKLAADISAYKKNGEIPYDFIRKRLTIQVTGNGKTTLISKGAFSNILSICNQYADGEKFISLDETKRKIIQDKFESLSKSGLRVLGLCTKECKEDKITEADEKEMVFQGFILLEDPLKQDAKESILKLNKMHTDVKIITGDNRYIAAYTARQLGIKDPDILTGDKLKTMSPSELNHLVNKIHVFAEIEPNQKESIVKALQKNGKTVAYMGDGINDVAAIHAADVGISVSDATEVAKEAADFVLMEKSLSVLADGIYEGRRSFANSMKYILINTGATFGNMFSVAGASLLLPFLPMLPKQILLTNFLTDFPYLAVSSDKVDDEQLIHPGKWNIKVIRLFMLVFGIHSSVFDFLTFGVMYFYFKLQPIAFQTGWFLESALSELLILFIIRTRKSFLKSMPGKMLLLVSVIAFLITVLLPISPFASQFGLQVAHSAQALALAAILLLYVITADIIKVIFFRRMKNKF